MSLTPTYTLFPELHDLRKMLNEFQTHYAERKPQLNSALEGLLPKVRTAPITALGHLLQAPSGSIPVGLQTCFDKTSAALTELDKALADPRRVAENIAAGNGNEIVEAVKTPILFLFQTAAEWADRIQGLEIGALRDEALHAYRRIVDLVIVLSNATFEALDSFPAAIRKGTTFESFFSAIQPTASSMSALPEFEPFWKLWAYWEARWSQRAGQENALRDWFNPASMHVKPTRNVRQLQLGDTLAQVELHKDKMQRVSISRGRLPVGMELNPQGRIVVSNPSALLPGYYEGLEISGITAEGRTFKCEVPEIIIAPYVAVTYHLSPEIATHDMGVGHVLASPVGPEGSVVEAQVTGGNLPAGVRFNTTTGIISVADRLQLVSGAYILEVTTTDKDGLDTVHQLTLELYVAESIDSKGQNGSESGTIRPSEGILVDTLPGSEAPEVPAPDALVVTVLEAKLPLRPEQMIGVVTAGDVKIESWELVEGSLPMGTKMDVSGELVVVEPLVTEPSRYFSTLFAVASNAMTYQIELEVRFLEATDSTTTLPNSPNAEIWMELDVAIPPFSLAQRTGKIICNLAPKGVSLVDSEIEKGELPSGLVLLENGTIKVGVAKALTIGAYGLIIVATDADGNRYRFHLKIEIIQ